MLIKKEISLVRQNICRTCEFRKSIICSKCWCFIKIKTKLATESCPIGKWAEQNIENDKKAELKNLINNLNSK